MLTKLDARRSAGVGIPLRGQVSRSRTADWGAGMWHGQKKLSDVAHDKVARNSVTFSFTRLVMLCVFFFGCVFRGAICGHF